MRLVSIAFEKYKCFEDRQELELKPLTVFFGKNGSGKSAALNAVPFLLYICVQENPGFQFDGTPPNSPGEFVDLIHRYLGSGYLGIGGKFEHEGRSLEIWVEIQNVPQESMPAGQVVSKFIAHIDNEPFLDLTWVLDKETTSFENGQAKYSYFERESVVAFKGAWPYASEDESLDAKIKDLNEWKKHIHVMFVKLTYLESIRALPEEIVKKQVPPPKEVGRSGQNAALVYMNNLHGCREKVNRWFSRDDVGGWHLTIKDFGPGFSLYGNKGYLEAPINKIGKGLGQVFPIVVSRNMKRDVPGLEVYEEPESHLHPAAHAAMADLFIDGLDDGNGPLIIETHSEIILIRMRRRVAEGKIKPEHVAIYWVDDEEESCQITPINVSRNGELSFWPDMVFSEDYFEFLALQKAEEG